jgi:hypothetical protein
MVVERVYDDRSTLETRTESGRAVGTLNWKPPRRYRSFACDQSGFGTSRHRVFGCSNSTPNLRWA